MKNQIKKLFLLAVALLSSARELGNSQITSNINNTTSDNTSIENLFKKNQVLLSTGNARKLIYDQDERFKITDKYFLVFAMNYLGNCYLYGIGVNKSNEDALYWYKKSARQGNNIAQYNLGRCYLMGEIVERDYKKAFNLFKKSAAKYNIEAMFSLGCLYFEGKVLERM